jgi:peptidoglycan/xylan/chitin deacetylase (PgdA/CDA1 family)
MGNSRRELESRIYCFGSRRNCGLWRGQIAEVKTVRIKGFWVYFCNLTSNLYNSVMLPALLGLTAAAAASAAGYQSMSPTGQWYGRTLTGGAPGSKQIALTFDDGPNDPHTLKLLDVLAKHSVRATFFMIGRFVRERPDIARAVAQAGHAIGNHTFTHPLLIFKSVEETRQQLLDCHHALANVIGQHSNLFRPPFGGRRPATLRVARELGFQTVMWKVTGYDWNAPPAAVIEEKVARQIRGGDVILLHDGGHRAIGADRAQTVIATENLIRRYRDQGYEFGTADGSGAVRLQP